MYLQLGMDQIYWSRKSFLDRSRVDTVTLVVFDGTERKPNGSPCVKVRIGTSFVQRQSEAWPAHKQSHSWCTVTARWGWAWSAEDKPIRERLNAVKRKCVRGIKKNLDIRFPFFPFLIMLENAKISIPKFREKLIKNILISVWFILSWYLHFSKYHFLIQKSCKIFISIFDILSFVFKFKIG